MKKAYIQPETKLCQAQPEAVLDFTVSVDPNQEGNQEEAEAEQALWDDDQTLHRHRSVWTD